MAKKQIQIYVICKYKPDERKGHAHSVLVYKNTFKKLFCIYGDKKEGKRMTRNRCILYGIIAAMEKLKEPCLIDLYVPCKLGFKSKSSNNKDLVKRICEIEKEKNHELNIIEDPITTKRFVHNIIKTEIEEKEKRKAAAANDK